MSTAAAATENPATIFRWDSPHRRRWGLLIFVVSSVILHAVCFYLFQITYPPTVALLAPPARVSLITAETEEGRVLLRWVEAEDPALASTTQRAPDAKSFALPQIAHVPSYATTFLPLRQLPPLEPDLRVPSANPPAPVRPPKENRAAPAAPKIATVVTFSPGLATAGAAQFPPVTFRAGSNEPPQVAEFRVAVSSDGIVRYCFLQNSSGDSALDEQARLHLTQARFAPGLTVPENSTLLWGSATIEWGRDIVPPEKAANATRAP